LNIAVTTCDLVTVSLKGAGGTRGVVRGKGIWVQVTSCASWPKKLGSLVECRRVLRKGNQFPDVELKSKEVKNGEGGGYPFPQKRKKVTGRGKGEGGGY